MLVVEWTDLVQQFIGKGICRNEAGSRSYIQGGFKSLSYAFCYEDVGEDLDSSLRNYKYLFWLVKCFDSPLWAL